MNASIKPRVAVAILGLLGTVGLLSPGSASAEPGNGSSDEGTVVVGTAGDSRYVATDNEVVWGDAGSTATFAVDRVGPVSEVPTNFGTAYTGTAGNSRYIVTDNEVIWGDASPTVAQRVASTFRDLTVVETDLGPIYVGTAGDVRYMITSNEVIWWHVPNGSTA